MEKAYLPRIADKLLKDRLNSIEAVLIEGPKWCGKTRTVREISLFHYRDKSGSEADAVIVLADGRWAAIEVKLGSKEIEEAAKHLIKLKIKLILIK